MRCLVPGPAASARGKLALAGAAVLALVVALAPGPLAPASLRALAAAAAIGAAAFLARGRSAGPASGRLAVISRRTLSRDAGLALVEVDGRALLLGFGAGGIRLLSPPAGPPPAPRPGDGAGVPVPAACAAREVLP